MPPLQHDGDLEEAAESTALAKRAQEQGEYDEARRLFERVLAIREDVLGPNHLEVAVSVDDLARLYREQHTLFSPQRSAPVSYERAMEYLRAPARADLAMPLYERALAIREQALGPDHPNVATSLDNPADLQVELTQALEHRGCSPSAPSTRAYKSAGRSTRRFSARSCPSFRPR
jgi:tetratricopeptide (TPR) repeat protein